MQWIKNNSVNDELNWIQIKYQTRYVGVICFDYLPSIHQILMTTIIIYYNENFK